MKQPLALIMLLIGSFITFLPVASGPGTDQSAVASSSSESASLDPDGVGRAFNVTYAQFDLYTENAAIQSFTNSTGTFPGFPPGTHASFSKVNKTQTGTPVAGTGFNHTIPASGSGMLHNQTVTLTVKIPKGNYSDPFIRFLWNGTVGAGTRATYRVLNDTTLVFERQKMENFQGGPPANATLPCGPNDECLNVSKYIGRSLTLVFMFNSTSTGTGLRVHVNSIIVASVSVIPNPAVRHVMSLMNPAEVLHVANFTNIKYNATERQADGSYHTFNQTAAIFYFPRNYSLDSIRLNATTIYPDTVALDKGVCTPLCQGNLVTGNRTFADTSFISLNMSYIGVFFYAASLASNATITARSANAVPSIEPLLGGALTDFWMPGDVVGVRMRVQPSLNVSGSHTVILTDPANITRASLPPTQNRGGTYVYNLTLPANAPLGKWNITAQFLNGYSFGHRVYPIRLEAIMATLSMTGGAGKGEALTVSGSLSYVSNATDAAGVNATVFAVDADSLPRPITKSGIGEGGLYISNVTLQNGVFTQGQQLIVLFTVTNPAPPTTFSATLTIEHEWYSGTGGSHDTKTTFPLTLGDEPFLFPSSFYKMDVSIASAGVEITVKSLRTNNEIHRILSPGTIGVGATRQHFGSFKISITSTSATGTSTNETRSPTYAYVLHPSLTPSGLLAFSSTTTTLSNGSFSATIAGDTLLGAKRLSVFVLARHSNGIALATDRTVTSNDSTFLTPTADFPGQTAVNQQITVTFRLKSNSTNLPITLTVNLDLSGSGLGTRTVDTKTMTIQPGATQPATFSFTSPSETGSYQLTFSSPQYGPPLLSKTLNVGLFESSLQVLIPAIIGLVAALTILGLYLIRRRPETELVEEKKRPATGKQSKMTPSPVSWKSLIRS